LTQIPRFDHRLDATTMIGSGLKASAENACSSGARSIQILRNELELLMPTPDHRVMFGVPRLPSGRARAVEKLNYR
jgi:hypothetical protein